MSTALDAGPHGRAHRPDAAAPSSGRGLASRGGQVLMLVAILAALAAGLVGAGLLGGTPVEETVGGWLGADATWVSPAGAAFVIWPVIYLGLLAYGLWQLTPGAQSARHDRARPWILASVLLNAGWVAAVQADLLGVATAVIVLLLIVLFGVLVQLESGRSRGVVETLLLDGVQGLHLGWISAAVLGNVAAWLGSIGWFGGPLDPTRWGQALLVVGVLIGAFTAVYSGGRLAPALALAWGLTWIGVGRADGTGLLSGGVALTAWGGAAIVLLCWLLALWLSRKSATGEARDLVLDALDGGDDPVDGIRR